MIRLEGDRTALYRWDLNQRVVLADANANAKVHFFHEKFDEFLNECPTVVSYEENGIMYANIPNILLQRHGVLTVYLYVQEDDKAYTKYVAEIFVLDRPKPATYVYTETEVLNYYNAVSMVETLSKEIRDAKEKGEFNGYTPKKGIDYYTEQDKSEMVLAVLKALPIAEGEEF